MRGPLALLRRIRRRIDFIIHHEHYAVELEEEMQWHVEQCAHELQQGGLSAAAASHTARRRFGNRTRWRHAAGDAWGSRWVDGVARDLRLARRRLRRTPVVTATIVLTLGITIGANSAIFGLINGIYLRHLSLPRPEELAAVRPMKGGASLVVSWPAVQQLRRFTTLPSWAAYRAEGMDVEAGGQRRLVWGDVVSSEYFPVLGIRPWLGRYLTTDDEQRAAPAVVVSYDLWRELYGGDSAAIGRPIRINDHMLTVVGVTPPSFTGLYFARRFAVAIPITTGGALGITDLANYYLDFVTRIPSRLNRRYVAADFARAFAACCGAGPSVMATAAKGAHQPDVRPDDPPIADPQIRSADRSTHVELVNASRGLTWGNNYRDEFGPALASLFAAVMVLTLIACANISTLLLARATVRRQEFGVRASLGASRSQLVRQLVVEALLLGVGGAAFGWCLAAGGVTLLLHRLPAAEAQLHDAVAWHGQPLVLGFTMLVTVGCTLVFGLWPAGRATRTELLLHRAARHPPPVGRIRGLNADHVLATTQVAFALTLMAAASLFIATLRNVARPGVIYGTPNVIFGLVSIDGPGGETGSRAGDLLARLRATPGVAMATLARSTPAFESGQDGTTARLPGEDRAASRDTRSNAVDPSFFDVTGIRRVRGRSFTSADDHHAPGVAIVTQRLGRQLFGANDPIGRKLLLGDSTATVVGVVADVPYELRTPASPMLYQPLAQQVFSAGLLTMVIRTRGDSRSMMRVVQRTASSVTGITVTRLTTLGDYMAGALVRERLTATLATIFGAIALLLVAIGLYGLLAYQTASRTAEIGVRMAMGASPGHAVRWVLRRAAVLVVAGVAIGVPLAVAAMHLLRAQLYGIGAEAMPILAGSGAALIAVALLASVVPAWHAAHVEPVCALSAE